MGTALVRLKIMPDSVEADLKKIKDSAVEMIKELAGAEATAEEEPVAFGLKAIILQFPIDESKSLEEIEAKIKEIKSVSSVNIIDLRRAFG